jgi:hypothetical protein
MKKKARKLKLTRETIQFLDWVSGGASEDACGYTSPRQCQLVPSVDYCGSNPVGGCNSAAGACNSTFPGCTYP